MWRYAAVLLLLLASCGGRGTELNQLEPSRYQQTGFAQAPGPDLEKLQQEVSDLAVPDDVDAALFNSLKRELSKLLAERTAAGQPATLADRVVLSYSDGALRWAYNLSGDYDQNGEVNLADLSALSRQFGKPGPYQRDSLERIADGDGNGEVGLSDLSPIAAGFGSTLESYRVYASEAASDYPLSREDGNGPGAKLIGELRLEEGSGSGRLQFSLAGALNPSLHYWLRIVSEGTERTASQLFPQPGWPLPGQNPQRSGQSPVNGPLDPALIWTQDFESSYVNSYECVIGDSGEIYLDTPQASLVCLNSDGSVRWEIADRDHEFHAAPTVSPDGSVLVVDKHGLLLAYNQFGDEIWRYMGGYGEDSYVSSSPLILADGSLLFAGGDQQIHALDRTGDPLWTFALVDNSAASLAAGAETEIYVSNRSNLRRLDASGKLVWSISLSASVMDYPVVSPGGDVLVFLYDNSVYSISPEGEINWSYWTWTYGRSAPAVANDGTIYVPGADNRLHALLPDGTLKWILPSETGVCGQPLIGADGTVYYGCFDGTVKAVSPDGKEYWSVDLGVSLQGNGALGEDGTLLFRDTNGGIHALADTPANIAPLADLAADRTSGPAPFLINLDASGSSDPDGNIILYEWDFDGDGSFDMAGTAANSSHQYETRGYYTARVRVTDDDGSRSLTEVRLALPSEWAMADGDARHTRRSPLPGPQAAALLWEYDAGMRLTDPVIGADGSILVGSYDNNVYSFSPAGELNWKFETDGHQTQPLAIADDGSIIATDQTGKLYSLDPAGAEQWKVNICDRTLSAPVISDSGTILVACYKGLFALDSGGAQLWQLQDDNMPAVSPAVDPVGVIAVLGSQQMLNLLDSDGQLLWQQTLDHASLRSPCISDDGSITVVTAGTSISRFDPGGAVLWQVQNDSVSYSAPALDYSGNMYLGSNWGFVTQFDEDGNLYFSRGRNGELMLAPVVDLESRIFDSSYRGWLMGFCEDCPVFWEVESADLFHQLIIARDGRIYVVTEDGKLQAYAEQ